MVAIEPPPAPISIMSTTGVLIGMPEPRLKRCTRAASIIGATSARPPSIRQDFAVVPPMSKAIASGSPAARANSTVASAPPAGPDSSRRIGKARATSGAQSPPSDCISRSGAAQSSAASSTVSRPM
jgi:hypothetical protein